MDNDKSSKRSSGRNGTAEISADKIKWLFFDLGSTLIDESECAEYRLRELLKQPNAPDRKTLELRMVELARENRLPYKDAAKEYGLQTVKWPIQLEKLYSDVPNVLKRLTGRFYLGIIANQSHGTEQRLNNFGIREYFDIIVASAEAGVSKPDPAIFELALAQAGCAPEELRDSSVDKARHLSSERFPTVVITNDLLLLTHSFRYSILYLSYYRNGGKNNG